MMDQFADIMSEAELKDRIKTKRMGRVLYYYETTTSTNEDAKRLAGEKAPDGTLVAADAQTGGRGRRGRSWESPAGNSIYFSLLLRPEIPSGRMSMLTLVMALSAAEAVEKACGAAAGPACPNGSAVSREPVLIKWPNDIVMGGRKICGILTELAADAADQPCVIIGVGINVNQGGSLDFPEQVREYAGSICMAAGQRLSRAALTAGVMEAFEKNYEIFLQTCDMTGLKDAYEAHLANIGRQVRVLDPKGEFTGTARGINDRGELLVERDDGTVESVYAGEVSVRGLYGYV